MLAKKKLIVSNNLPLTFCGLGIYRMSLVLNFQYLNRVLIQIFQL